MKPIVKICGKGNNIQIIDLTQDSEEYIPEDIQDTLVHNQNNKFKYSETMTVNIIQYNSTTESNIEDTIISNHDSEKDEAEYKLNKDGYYTIHHLILPTVEWLNKELEKEDNLTNYPINIYVTDGINIYNYQNEKLEETDLDVIIKMNTSDTTISRISLDTFLLFYLRQCFISYCKKIFDESNLRCNKEDYDYTFNRDLLWMTINIIKYNVEFNQMKESQRILEKINRCGNICQNISLNKINSCGCN